MDTPLFTPRPIGFVHTPYKDTSAIPKGLGAQHKAEGSIEILPEFEQGLLDIEGFSHLFIIWVFHHSEGFELQGAPPGEPEPHGVFATRSPRRPNPLGLTLVKLVRREEARLHLYGVDMLDGTPVLDIKPCMSAIPADILTRGWLEEAERRRSQEKREG